MAIMGIVLVQNATMLGFWEDILAWLEHTTAPDVAERVRPKPHPDAGATGR